LRFTAEDESLFLLDEPDTHLNPRWCVDYLGYLKPSFL
jgi:predicted ATP-dependent endonuclease of OLD family